MPCTCAQNDESMMHKPHSADSTSATCRSKTPISCMSSLHLRPQISVKLPAISMKKVQKNPDQLTIEDLPAIRSQVVCICTKTTFLVKSMCATLMLLIRLREPTADSMFSREREASRLFTHLQIWAAFPDGCSCRSCSFWQPTMSSLSTFLPDWHFTWLISSPGSRRNTAVWSRFSWTSPKPYTENTYCYCQMVSILSIHKQFSIQCCMACHL